MAGIPNVTQATRQYETWLANHLHVLKNDIWQKHQMMALDPFSFIRATLFHAMGWELANVHFGTKRAAAPVRRDLSKRKSNWLCHATELMTDASLKDWKEWRKTAS